MQMWASWMTQSYTPLLSTALSTARAPSAMHTLQIPLSFRIHIKSEQQKKMEHLCRSKLHSNEDEHIFTDPNCATKKMNMIFADPNCTPKKMNIFTDPNWEMKRMSILCTTYRSSIFQDLHKSEQPKKMNMILTDPNWAMKMKMRILADLNYTNEEDQHPCRFRLRNEEGEHHPCRCGLCNEEDEHVLVDPNWAMKKMSLLADPKLRNEEEDDHPCRSKFHIKEDEHPGCSTEAWWPQRCNTRLHKSVEEQEEKLTLSEMPLGFFCLRL